MSSPRTCPQCSAPVHASSPSGYCGRCLFGLGFLEETQGDETDHPDACGEPGFPRRFGSYELLGEIARGGMGVVYRARQIGLNRIVALKMILPGPFASRVQSERFRIEAEAAARLQHPHIVRIFETGVADGHAYFSMDYLEGGDLASLVRSGPLPVRRASDLARKLAGAIDYAHERGILHRDLKPSNVLLDAAGEPHLTDFGLAAPIHEAGILTVTGEVLGSPSFMPPEQALGQRGRIGRHSDLYGLGSILFFLLTGRPPFLAESLTETLAQVIHADPISPRLIRPEVPPDLATICLKCLEKDPGRRYPTARALTDDLERFLGDRPILARPVGTMELAWRWSRRNRALASLLAVSADGRTLATASTTGRLRLWDVPSGERLAELVGHSLKVWSVVFSPVAPLVVTASSDRTLRLWDSRSGAPIRTLLGHGDEVWHVGFSPDGRYLVSGDKGGILMLWDLGAAEGVRPRLPFPVLLGQPRWSPDGTSFAIGIGSNQVAILEPETLSIRHRLPGAALPLSFSKDGSSLDVLTPSGLARASLQNLELHPLGPLDPLPLPHQPSQISRSGRWLAIEQEPGMVLLWDLLGRRLHRRLSLDARGGVINMAFSPDEQALVVTVYLATTVQVFDQGFERRRIIGGHRLNPWDSAFSPDGRMLATAAMDDTVRLWDFPSGKELAVLRDHREGASGVTFSPDGRTLVAQTLCRRIKFWNVATLRELGDIEAPSLSTSVSVAPGSRHLLAWCPFPHALAIHHWPIDAVAAPPPFQPRTAP